MTNVDKIKQDYESLGIIPSLEEATELIDAQLEEGIQQRQVAEDLAKKELEELEQKKQKDIEDSLAKDFFDEKEVKQEERNLVRERAGIEELKTRGFAPGGPIQSTIEGFRETFDPDFKRIVGS